MAISLATANASLLLNSGQRMPLLGLGTSPVRDVPRVELALNTALKAGYRHFDTAFNYGNEVVLGRVFRTWLDTGLVTREELFIVTKLPGNAMRPDLVPHFLSLSLTALQLDYVDLYLIQTPIGYVHRSGCDSVTQPTGPDGKVLLDLGTDLVSIWTAMERQVDRGLTKSIGLSNFTQDQIQRVVAGARIRPACLQVEMHLYFQQCPLRDFCEHLGISVTAYAVLGSPGRVEYQKRHGLPIAIANVPQVLNDPVVTRLAAAHNKTCAQVLLRFFIQQGIAVIPKSSNPGRILANANVFDFQLTGPEMEELVGRCRSQRTICFSAFHPGVERHPEFRF